MRWFTGLLAVAAFGLVAGCAAEDAGPEASDFVDMAQAAPNPPEPVAGPDASTGTFTVSCGRNENNHNNADNFVRRPGEHGGVHLEHEYVGNVSTNASSTNESLAAAGTTCAGGDQSTYYWPVLRLLGSHHGHGSNLRPASVLVRFNGNPASKVIPMPRFLRISTGNAKAFTHGGATARWTCSGSRDRSTSGYPRCPAGEQVVRIFEFPGCWDGRGLDVVVHAAGGVCPHRTFPIPALTLTVTYDVPHGALYAIDSFPDQRHSPLTDHADFTNVMTDDLMFRVVSCINHGQNC
jgi:hypothetical protein